jgi:uncharacterized protein with GYD domain
MPKYLGKVKFAAEAVQGLRAQGAANRVEITRALVEGVGGTLEAYYFAFGEWDLYNIFDVPDDETATALSLAVNGSGVATGEIVKLLTPQQIDAAFAIEVGYRPPGA